MSTRVGSPVTTGSRKVENKRSVTPPPTFKKNPQVYKTPESVTAGLHRLSAVCAINFDAVLLLSPAQQKARTAVSDTLKLNNLNAFVRAKGIADLFLKDEDLSALFDTLIRFATDLRNDPESAKLKESQATAVITIQDHLNSL